MAIGLSAGAITRYGQLRKTLTVVSGGLINFLSGAQVTYQSGAKVRYVPRANPGTCVQGEVGVDATGRFVVCSATNTWTVVGTQV
jgi:hypothetical protein